MNARSCIVALVTSFVCLLCPINKSTAKSVETKEAQAEKRAKQQEAEDERMRKEQENESKLALAKQLNDAQNVLAKAKLRQKEGPAAYANALASLASAYQSSNDLINANKYHNQALEQVEAIIPESEMTKVNITSLWNLLSTVPDPEFGSRFERLLRVTELKFPDQSGNLVLNGIRNRQYRRSDHDAQIADQLNLLEVAIRVYSSIYGPNDAHLAPLIREYGSEFEASNNLVEAEKQMRRSFDLTKPLTDDVRASQEIELAQFYLRHQMRDKMNESFNKAVILCHGHIAQNVAYNFSFLTSAYTTSSYGGNPEDMFTTLLASGGDEIVRRLDPQIDTLVKNYINSGALPRAEKLLRRRVEASDKCTNDINGNVWRLRLSDTLLAQGRDAESNKLFEQVRSATILAGGSTDQMVSNREALLERLGKAGNSQAPNQSPSGR